MRHLGNESPRISRDLDHMQQEPRRYSPGSSGPVNPPKLNADVQMPGRPPAYNSPEKNYPGRVTQPFDDTSQSQKEQTQRSVSTPSAARCFYTDPVQSGKKQESRNLLPRT